MKNRLDIICRYIFELKKETTNLVLQKLLYFIQAYVLVATDGKRKAFDESIEAWMYGPVIPEVYRNYKKDNNFYKNFSKEQKKLLDQDKLVKEAVENVVKNLGDLNPYTLVNLTHSYAPWQETWDSERNTIRDQDIFRYHQKKNIDEGSIV